MREPNRCQVLGGASNRRDVVNGAKSLKKAILKKAMLNGRHVARPSSHSTFSGQLFPLLLFQVMSDEHGVDPTGKL